MGKFHHTLHRWRSTIFREAENEVTPRLGPPPEPANQPTEEPQIPGAEPPPHLTPATISGTWKVLPQELIDYIFFMLEDDLRSLKACSSTCKLMFVSARRIIHRKIYLSSEKNWELLTLPERRRYLSEDRLGLAVKMLPELAAHGVLPYARQLFINLGWDFTPTNLQPFNHHFQRFDRIQELSISRLDTPGFLKSFDTYFASIVPTLLSLHLEGPTGETRDILDFICRFPHLDDLSLKMSISTDPRDRRTWSSRTLPVVKNMPPFRGRLKLDGIIERRDSLLQQLSSLPGKRSFRSIVFRNCESEAAQPIVNACCGTLESVSTTWGKFTERGLPLNLTDATNLRSLTLRVAFGIISLPNDVLFQTLSTITSPFFSEFVLEVEKVPTNLEPGNDAWGWWGRWIELDEMFERIDMERGFRVVFRAEEVDRESNFTAQAEGQLPLIVARKGVVFEIGPFPET